MPLRKLRFSFLIIFIIGCSQSNSLLEEAYQLENAGMHQEALEKYVQMYRANPSSVDAQIGAKKEANILLNNKVGRAKSVLAIGQFDAALALVEEIETMLITYQWLQLEKPLMLDLIKQEALQAKSDWLYNAAESAVLNEQYEAAEIYLNQLYRIDPSRQEIQYLRLMMEIIPNYQKGKKAMGLGLYKEAFGYFKSVTDVDADYKDALKLLNECKERASFTIAFVTKSNKNGFEQIERTLAAEIKQSIIQLKDPLIRLVDRDHLDQIIEEQQQMMEAAFSESNTIEAGNLLGAEYVVVGELVDYRETTGRITAVEKKGWLGTNLRAPKVKYMEYAQKRSLDGGFRYQLMNAETGEVIAAGNIPFCVDDEIHYARFNGNKDLLHSGFWKYQLIGSSQDYIEFDSESKNAIDQLLNGRDQLKSTVDLQFELSRLIASQIAQEINAFAATR